MTNGCITVMKKLLIFNTKDEDLQDVREMLKLCSVLVQVGILNNLLMVVCVAFVGHEREIDLAAISLTFTVLNLFVIAFSQGLVSGCEAYAAQAFGSGQNVLVGILLQKSLICHMVSICVLSPIFLNIESILILLGQDRDVSKIAGNLVLWLIPGIFLLHIWSILTKYLAILNYFVSICLITALGVGVCALCMYVFVEKIQLGVWSAAIALDITWLFMVVAVSVYIRIEGCHKKYWPGFSWQALSDLWPFAQHCLSAVAGSMMEWGIFEAMVILSGVLGQASLATAGVFYNTLLLICSEEVAVSIATSIKVGQALGGGEPRRAAKYVRIAYGFTVLQLTVTVGVILGLHHHLPYLFTNSVLIGEAASDLFPVMAVLHIAESVVYIGRGVNRGSGKIYMAVIVCAITYGTALILGTCLVLKTDLGIAGGWLALTSSSAACSVFYTIYIFFIVDWDDLSLQALERMRVTEPKQTHGSSEFHESDVLLVKDDQSLLGTEASTYGSRICRDKEVVDKSRLTRKAFCICAASLTMVTVGVLCRCLMPHYALGFDGITNHANTTVVLLAANGPT